VLGNRRHIECDKGSVNARTVAMQGLGYQLLTGTRLTVYQHGDIAVGQSAYGAKYLLHGGCFANDFGMWKLFQHWGIAPALASVCQSALGDGNDLVEVEGFGQVFK